MKKENFYTLIFGVIGGMLFACYALSRCAWGLSKT